MPHALLPSPKLKLKKIIIYFFSGVFCICSLFALILGLVISTETGTRLLWNGAKVITGGRLKGSLIQGKLLSGISIRNFFFDKNANSINGIKIKIDHLHLQWGFNYRPFQLKIARLQAGNIDILMNSTEKVSSSSQLKQFFQVPFPISVLSTDIDSFRIYKCSEDSFLSFFPHFESKSNIRNPFIDRLLTYEFHRIRLFAALHKDRYKVIISHMLGLQGELSGELTLAVHPPFNVRGRIDYSIPSHVMRKNWTDKNEINPRLKIHISLEGSLTNLLAKMQAFGLAGSAQGEAELSFFDDLIFKRGSLKGDHINPYFLFKDAPNADLSINMSLKPQHLIESSLQSSFQKMLGNVLINNTLSGKFDNGRLPIKSAVLSFVLDKEKTLRIGLARFHLNDDALILGKGIWNPKKGGDLRFNLKKLNLHSFYNGLRRTKFDGKINLDSNNDMHRCQIHLSDQELPVELQAILTRRINQKHNRRKFFEKYFNLDEFIIKAAGGVVSAKGSFGQEKNTKDLLSVNLKNFDPFVFMDSSFSQITFLKAKNAKLRNEHLFPDKSKRISNLSGNLKFKRFFKSNFDKPITEFIIKLERSFYGNSPLYVNGKIHFSNKIFWESNLSAQLADNTVQLTGKLNNKVDKTNRINFRIDAPHIEKLGFGLAGNLLADGKFLGNLSSLDCNIAYNINNMVLGAYRIGSAVGNAKFNSSKGGLLEWSNYVQDLFFSNVFINQANIDLSGTYAKHNLFASLEGQFEHKKIDLDFFAHGGFKSGKWGDEWHGVFDKLVNKGGLFLQVNRPISFVFRRNGCEIGAADIEIDGARVGWSFLIANQDEITSKGYIYNFEVIKWLRAYQKISGKTVVLTNDLLLDGKWNFSLTNLVSRGFISVNSTDGYFSRRKNKIDSVSMFNLGRLEAFIKFSESNNFHFMAKGNSSHLGSFSVNLCSAFKKNGAFFYLDKGSLISGSVKANLPNLANLSSLLGEGYSLNGPLLGREYALNGSLFLNTKVDGSVTHPVFNGEIIGNNLSLNLLDSGLALRDGEIDILLNEKFINLRKVIFKGGGGRVDVGGKISLKETKSDVAAHIKAEKLELFSSPERQLVLSGQGIIKKQGRKHGLDINGKIFINRALFDLPKFAPPKLSEDVIILDKHQARRYVKKQKKIAYNSVSKFAPFSHILVDFGNNFRFQGRGAKLDLTGQLVLQSEPSQPIKGYGEIRIGEGSSYEFMGRKFAVENGVIAFDGPIDNPSLHLRAMRRNQEVEVGLRIAGTAKMPKIDFISEPPHLALEEKLSWLMFGRGSQLESNLGQDAASNAALGVLSGLGGKSLANRVGLDSFSIGSSDGGVTAPQVLQISKSFGEKLLLGHEYGLSTSESLFKAVWQFSRYWSITAHIGNAHVGKLRGCVLNFFKRFD